MRQRLADAEEQLARLRRLCSGLPQTTEKLSHGEPTFFNGKRVYAMFDNNHHGDGHVAVWVPAAPGVQENLVATRPRVFFRPPYVGVRGWVGIELDRIDDEELLEYLSQAWRLVGPKKKLLR
ncbi:MAG TPA: MmcQ/YjbR family DNA-binding protein [Bryobacteraceae bacterium]|nr:MmcQ/YjbR family DNA-binding protein [Bryobacteraceae bacterium]